MKLYKLFGTAAMAAAMLTSCAETDAPAISGGEAVGPVEVTFSVSRGAQSRTALTETTAAGLSDVWTSGDALQVYTTAGKKVGTVVLAEDGDGQHTASFTGTLTGLTQGDNNLRVWYLANDEYFYETSEGSGELIFDMAVQPGAFENLADFDVMTSPATVNVPSGTESVLTGDITMTNCLAFAHIRLDLSDDATVKNQSSINITQYDAEGTPEGTSEDIIVNAGTGEVTAPCHKYGYNISGRTLASARSQEIYMALWPMSGANLLFDFSNGVANDAITGSLNGIDIAAGVYYNGGAVDDAEGTTGTGDRTKPVTVTLAPKEPQRPETMSRIREYYSLGQDGELVNIACVRNPVPGTTTTVQAANYTVDGRCSDHVVLINADGSYTLGEFVEGTEVPLTYVESYDGPMGGYRGECALVVKFILAFDNTLAYDLNGGSLPAGATMPESQTVTLYGNAPSTFTFTAPGFTPVAPDADHRFKGWSTRPDYSDDATYLKDGDEISAAGTVTVYAVWQGKTTTSGGGTGEGSGSTGSGNGSGSGSFGGQN